MNKTSCRVEVNDPGSPTLEFRLQLSKFSFTLRYLPVLLRYDPVLFGYRLRMFGDEFLMVLFDRFGKVGFIHKCGSVCGPVSMAFDEMKTVSATRSAERADCNYSAMAGIGSGCAARIS